MGGASYQSGEDGGAEVHPVRPQSSGPGIAEHFQSDERPMTVEMAHAAEPGGVPRSPHVRKEARDNFHCYLVYGLTKQSN